MNGFKRLRLLAGMNVVEVANALNVSPSTVLSWEKNKSKPQPGKIKPLAALYNCSTEAIVDAYAAQD